MKVRFLVFSPFFPGILGFEVRYERLFFILLRDEEVDKQSEIRNKFVTDLSARY